jgi:predicted GIY-YIG superfamily endonuclease
MRQRNYYVYIMSSLSRTLYTGVTNVNEIRSRLEFEIRYVDELI